MTVLALGLNHVTAPIAVRDRLAFSPDVIRDALRDLCTHTGVQEATILSTCNRVEIYTVGEANAENLIAWLAHYRRLPRDELIKHLYYRHHAEAIRHVMRVASGLDSMVLGEPQIFGQMKDAFATAKEAGTVGSELSHLFQQTFSVAKQVRTETAIGASAVSVAYAAVQLAKRIFDDLSRTTVLFIGAGETIALCAQHLANHGVKNMIVANRTVARAQELAMQYGGEAIALYDIPSHLARADIVISSTASQLPLLGKGAVESAIKARKHKLMFMVDLAVPRDIEPEVAKLDDVFLYTVDDLNGVVQENLKAREDAAVQAESIIVQQVEQFLAWQRSRDASGTIRELRERTTRWQDDEVQRAITRLRAGDSADDVVKQLAHRLGNKFLHAPSLQLRQAAAQQDASTLACARRLFDLDTATDES